MSYGNGYSGSPLSASSIQNFAADVLAIAGGGGGGPPVDLTPYAGLTSSNTFTTSQFISGNFGVSGTITANEFHVKYVTSSVLYESGSTKFGNDSLDTHQFTGSVSSTGGFTGSFKGDIAGTSSYATSSSYALTAGYIKNAESSSYALTAAYVQNAQSASYSTNAASASTLIGFTQTDYLTTSSFDSYTGSSGSQFAGTSSYSLTAGYVKNAESSSYSTVANAANSLNGFNQSDYTTTASFDSFTASYNTGSFSGSFSGDGSKLTNLTVPAGLLAGTNNVNQGFFANVGGQSNKVYGSSSFAHGLNTEASGNYSTAFGVGSKAKGEISFALGENSKAGAYSSVALIGGEVGLFADYALAAGPSSKAYGTASFVFGTNSQTYGDYSFVGGLWNIASGSQQTVFGQFNRPNTNSLFIVGNGSPIARNNILEVNSNGIIINGSVSASNYIGISQGSQDLTPYALTGSTNTFKASQIITGSLNVSNGITGSLQGTASYATNAKNAETASYLTTASAIPTFTGDVREQLSAGTNLNYSIGQFSVVDSPAFTNLTVSNDTYFQNNITVNGTASIRLLNYINTNELSIGEQFIVLLSGAPDMTSLDNSGIKWGSGSVGETVDRDAHAYIIYDYISGSTVLDKLRIYPGIITNAITATYMSGTLTGTASYATNAGTAASLTGFNKSDYLTTASFNSYTGSSTSTFAGTASYITASNVGGLTAAITAQIGASTVKTGSWIPTVTSASNESKKFTFSTSGYYVKNGGIVNAYGTITCTTASGTGTPSASVTFGGLPFTAVDKGPVILGFGRDTSAIEIRSSRGYTVENTKTFLLFEITGPDSSTVAQWTTLAFNLRAGSVFPTFTFSISYFTNE